MKIKLLTFTLFLLVSSIQYIQAQIFQGSYLVGGNISAAYYSGKISAPGGAPELEYSLTEIALNPKAGYFFKKPFVAGLSAEYVYQFLEFKSEEGRDTSNSIFVGGPFARYYFPNLIFVEGSFGYGKNTVNDTEDITVMRAAGGVGYAAFINEKMALEPMLRYVYDSREMDGDIKDTRGGLQLTIGLQIYLYRNQRTIFKQTL